MTHRCYAKSASIKLRRTQDAPVSKGTATWQPIAHTRAGNYIWAAKLERFVQNPVRQTGGGAGNGSVVQKNRDYRAVDLDDELRLAM